MALALNLGGTITLSYVNDSPVMLAGTTVLGSTSLPVRELDPVNSHWLGWSHLLALRRELLAAYASGERHFLVLTGTDSAEDLVYFLDLVRPGDTRVLVLVAMRTATYDEPRPDGLAMALDWLAADSAGIGLCWGEAIIDSPLPEKVWQGRWLFRAIAWSEKLAPWRVDPGTALSEKMPIVPILSVGIGANEWHAPNLRPGNFDGLIIEGFASGDVPPDTAEALIALVGAGYPVVLASRSRPGRIRAGFPGIAGTSYELLRHGLLGAAQLDPHRARLRLALALACGRPEELTKAFNGTKEGEQA